MRPVIPYESAVGNISEGGIYRPVIDLFPVTSAAVELAGKDRGDRQ
jgi:hypothetical protein